MSPRDSEGLSLGYRAWYRFRYVMLQVLGPPQLSGSQNPLEQLRREREAKIEEARRRRGTDS